ncbi:hypothetical protein ACIQV3_40410 [Streptomyces sp. NPDC099050]|uniref:hypothetical protein n=1 Tax=Streptomyces sp. NPDC099050 TaxID=3366100 RepID=UPI003812163E
MRTTRPVRGFAVGGGAPVRPAASRSRTAASEAAFACARKACARCQSAAASTASTSAISSVSTTAAPPPRAARGARSNARVEARHPARARPSRPVERAPWSAARREAYANDQNSPDTLIAVSAAFNRSKSDKDPAEWLPSDGGCHCTYAANWVGTKLRWDLAADENEVQALLGLAEDCPSTTVVYETAP